MTKTQTSCKNQNSYTDINNQIVNPHPFIFNTIDLVQFHS